MHKVAKNGFLIFVCGLFILVMSSIVVYASVSSADVTSDNEEEYCEEEQKGETYTMGWGEEEIGDISPSEIKENESEEMVEDFDTSIRVHPVTGELLLKEDVDNLDKED
ncbi:MAG: hypothetical protein LUG83_07910 [Lachnospiraceae bacterium]|nr:hypothetical protein [Lachnospiraceae bacterium]